MEQIYDLIKQYFNIVREAPAESKYSLPAADLVQPEVARVFLEAYRVQIQGQDLQVASTYFAAYWRGVCSALQYIVSVAPKTLDFSLDNFVLHLAEIKGVPQLLFVLKDGEAKAWPFENREQRREKVLSSFYGDTLRPFFECVASVSGLKLGQLWYQLPLGIEYYVNLLGSKLELEEDRARLKEDLRYLVEGMSPAVFGLKQNPFAFKRVWIDDPHHPGEKMPQKPTCCLKYRTGTNQSYCYSCPKMSKEQREQKYAAIRERVNNG